jgi:SAM-dependent methyltransferase
MASPKRQNLTTETTATDAPKADITEYFKPDWREHYTSHLSPIYKRAIYALTRPLISWNARRHLSRDALRQFMPRHVFGARGWPLEWLRKTGAAGLNIREATVLVQGTGTGWDTITWAALKPKRIIATDLFSSTESWEEIAKFCRDAYGTTIEFREAPLEDHSFLANGSVDLCGSDAVFEHVKKFPAMLAESYRVLRPGGLLYATYGPLWNAAGGDHYSGRGGIEHLYNHVSLNDEAYKTYFYKHLSDREDWQGAARYYELDLFSRLKTEQYLNYYKQAGFMLESLILFISPEAIAFRKLYPERFQEIAKLNRERLHPDDLIISGNSVVLKKP